MAPAKILAKVPVSHQVDVKAAYWPMFDPPAKSPSERSIAVARSRAETFSATSRRRFWPRWPDSTTIWRLFTYLRFPVEHHKRIRYATFTEPAFGETRRRVKLIGPAWRAQMLGGHFVQRLRGPGMSARL
jgi:putative transposase